MLKQGRLSQVGLMAALLKSVGRLKRRGGSSPSSSAVKEAKRIVDELTIEYDMNNIYRIRLVE